MAYAIQRTGDLIEIIMGLSSSDAELLQLREDIKQLSEGQRRDILVDISQTDGTLPVPGNLYTFFDDLPFRHYAIFGARPSAALVTKHLLDELPENANLKFFHAEEDARAWLEEQ